MLDMSYKNAVKEPLLTVEEEKDVIYRWQQHRDPKALERLVRSHARLAYSYAYRYTKNQEHLKDLAAEGMIGLMTAADKFDPEMGVRFATYSRWWVMTKISDGLPVVSTPIDIPPRTFMDARSGKLTGNYADKAHTAVYGGVNLDAPITEDEGMTEGDRLECQRPNPEQAAEQQSDENYRQGILSQCMADLSEREQSVIYRRKLKAYPETLETISQDMGVTRERVRQIESRALARLKKLLTDAGFSVSMLRE